MSDQSDFGTVIEIGHVVLLRPVSNLRPTIARRTDRLPTFAHTFDKLETVNVGDLVRIGKNGLSQFRVVEVDDTHARILSTLDAPGAYTFPLRITDLTPWTE